MGQLWLDVPGVEVLEELGRGAHGIVYRAKRGAQELALKVPHARDTDGPSALRLRREGIRLARVDHPSVPRVFRIGTTGEVPYLLMELVDGYRLIDLLAEGPLSEPQAVRMTVQIGEAIGRMHEAGFAHRDVHPRNILLARASMDAFLVDFGTSGASDETHGQSGVLVRTVSPLGGHRSGEEADLESLAVLLLRSLVQTQRITAKGLRHLLVGDRRSASQNLERYLPHATPALRTLLAEVFSRPDDEAPRSVDRFVADLRELLSGSGRHATSRRERTSSRVRTGRVLVGRDQELDVLSTSLARVDRGGRSLVSVVGNSGSGKSLLMRAFVDRSLASRPCLVASCEDSDPRPFAAVKGLLDACLHSAEHGGPQAIEALRSCGREVAPVLCALEPRLADAFHAAAPMPAASHVDDVFVDGLALFFSLWAAEAGPILVDDAQWIDRASERVLVRAMECSTSGLFVLAYRTESERSERDQRLHQEVLDDAITIRLKPFSRSEVAELIGAHLASNEVPPDLSEYITRVGDGTPFAVLSVLLTLLDHGALAPHWGKWVFNREQAGRIGLSPGVREAARRRVSDLSESSHRCLELAAVVGTRFRSSLLTEVSGESTVEVSLSEAEDALLIERVSGKGDLFRFAHDQVREALLSHVDDRRRRALHGAIAIAIDGMGERLKWSDDAERLYSVVHHYIEAGLERHHERTFDLCGRAGRAALESCDLERALRYFRAAEVLVARSGVRSRGEFHRSFGEALVRSGAMREGSRHLEKALLEAADNVERSRIHLRIAWVYRAELRADEAWGALEAAFAALGTKMPNESFASVVRSLGAWCVARGWFRRPADGPLRRRLAALCELLHETARLATESGRMLRAPLATLRVIGPAERIGPSGELSKGYLLYSYLCMMLGLRRKSDRYGDAAERAALTANDPVAYAYSLQVRFAIYSWGGRLDDAIAVGSRCVTQFGHWQELRDYCIAAYSLQHLESLRGRAEHAWPWMDRAARRLSQRGELPHVTDLFRHGVAASLTALGRESEVDAHLKGLPRAASTLPSHSEFGVWAFGPRVRVYTESGDLGPDFEAVVAEFDRAKHRPDRVHPLVSEYYVHVVHARVHAWIRSAPTEKGEAAQRLRAAFQDLRAAAKIPLLRAHVSVIQAYYLWSIGKRKKAAKAFLAAERSGRQQQSPWVLFAAARGRAHLLREEGNDDMARVAATVAAALARDSGHIHRLRWVREEFGLVASAGSVSASTSSNLSSDRGRPAFDPRQLPRLRSVADPSSWEPGKLDRSVAVRRLLDEIVEIFGADRGDLLIASEEPGPFRLVGSRTARQQDADAPTLSVQAFYDHAAQTSRDAIFQDTGTWYEAPESLLALPVVDGERCWAVIGLVSRLGRGVFSDTDVDRLNGLAHQVWTALTLIVSAERSEDGPNGPWSQGSRTRGAPYRALLTAVSDPVVVVDVSRRVVLDANEAAAKLLGVDVVDLVGGSFEEALDSENLSRFEASLREATVAGEAHAVITTPYLDQVDVLLRATDGREDEVLCVFRGASVVGRASGTQLN